MATFGSKQRPEPQPELQDSALEGLSRMFLSEPGNPTPGSEFIDVSRFDFSVDSLGAMDEHLQLMRTKALDGRDLNCFVLRGGAYVGEVIRRHAAPAKSWHWLDYDQAVALQPGLSQFGKYIGTVALLWDGKDGFIFPLAKVGQFLANGPEDSVKFYAQVIIAGPPPLNPRHSK